MRCWLKCAQSMAACTPSVQRPIVYRLERLDQLGDSVGQRFPAAAADIVSKPITRVQIDWLVGVRPKIVHEAMRIGAYSCVIPFNDERTLRPQPSDVGESP
jgi:hypothetical protein